MDEDSYSTRPIKEIDILSFKDLKSNKEIRVSPHAFDMLSERQRKVFKEEELLYMVARETPRKIYLQENGRYCAFYRKTDGYRKLILEFEENILSIVTFVDVVEIPNYKLEK